MPEFKILSLSLNDTKAYAFQLSNILEAGDVVILEGGVGAGKTQFTKFCVEALGYKNVVTSPSYTLANLYSLNAFNIVHADFYRINNELELYDIGLENYFENAVMLIEWGDKFQDFFDDFLKIKFEHTDGCQSCRKLIFTYKGRRWAEKFKVIENNLDSKN